ncbi:MAG: hypothetical protein ACPL7I_09520 [Myxococcota bacterium]
MVWPNGYHCYDDQDGDGLDDEWEIANCDIMQDTHYPCKNKVFSANFQWQVYKDWSEGRAKGVENNYPNNSLSRDWSAPGTNY